MSEHKMTHEVLVRLRRVEGHVRGVHEMVANDRPCADVLMQLGAVRAAVSEIGRIVLEDHLSHCLASGSEEELDAFKQALARFIKST